MNKDFFGISFEVEILLQFVVVFIEVNEFFE